MRNRLIFPCAALIAWVASFCAPPQKTEENGLNLIPNRYAEGFAVYEGEGFKVLEVTKAFPDQQEPFRYLIKEGPVSEPELSEYQGVVNLPVSKVVLTSTTQVPHLDYLDVSHYLAGFPNLSLISSPQVRELIDIGKVEDLGMGAQANVERMIDLEPDWVMISTLGEDLKHVDLLRKAGIAAVLNGEYVEQHPLGRAEWIKFTGALLGKLDEANRVFETIEEAYLEAATLVEGRSLEQPTVMAGVMYKDIWYVPGSESWGARLLQAAGGKYVFEEQKGTGSSQLAYEYVLDQAQDADCWIGASDFKSLAEMKRADGRYAHFGAFKNGEVYTYTQKKGPTGGLEYFELGYLRPDLILKDLIKILHPELLPDYVMYFYSRLDEK